MSTYGRTLEMAKNITDGLLANITATRHICTLDLTSGHFQIGMRLEDIEKN